MEQDFAAEEVSIDDLARVSAGEFKVIDFGGVQVVIGKSSMYVCGSKECTLYDW